MTNGAKPHGPKTHKKVAGKKKPEGAKVSAKRKAMLPASLKGKQN